MTQRSLVDDERAGALFAAAFSIGHGAVVEHARCRGAGFLAARGARRERLQQLDLLDRDVKGFENGTPPHFSAVRDSYLPLLCFPFRTTSVLTCPLVAKTPS